MSFQHFFILLHVSQCLWVQVRALAQEYQAAHPDVSFRVIQSTYNTRYHGRFHAAFFASQSEWVSVWDDDQQPDPGFLAACVKDSVAHGDALVGGNSRCFTELLSRPTKGRFVREGTKNREGFNDFVGHTWTLKRALLVHFLRDFPLSTASGEDIQLSFALQKVGIKTYYSGKTSHNVVLNAAEDRTVASYKQPETLLVRQYLFCKILAAGFEPLQCPTCKDPERIQSCLNYYRPLIIKMKRGDD